MKVGFLFCLFFNTLYVNSFAINTNSNVDSMPDTIKKCYIDGVNNCESRADLCRKEKWETASPRERYLNDISIQKTKDHNFVDWIGTSEWKEYSEISDYIEYVCSPETRKTKFFSIRFIKNLKSERKYDIGELQ
ncbi:MAG: hypothetical protein Ta2D_08810 [Rickettsiales bacterium]|nr:MAG: hypothetical protein Ta2D_08810 [Rickettsiales bacterium]